MEEKLIEAGKTLLNPYVQEWKEKGKKVVGYTCTYVPEEIIYAADILPFRIRATGCADTSLADAYMGRSNCSFSRSCLELGLRGEYDFLDGYCYLNGCDHIRRVYDNWVKYLKPKTPFMHFLFVPRALTPEGLKYYREEANIFKEHLEEHFGLKITPEGLRDAIKVFNETRRLLERLYDLRKGKESTITGAQTMRIVIAAASIPKDKFNQLLKEALGEINNRKEIPAHRARVMVCGSLIDDPTLLEVIEDAGALVVTDSLCFGTRHFLDLVDEDGDPMDAITKRYYNHNPCPRMLREYPRKLEFIRDLAREASVDGVIFEQITFCDLHGVDNVMISKDLEKLGIPTLRLQREYTIGDVGRFRTRVQAFLERIGR